jgi:hypothetical protein
VRPTPAVAAATGNAPCQSTESDDLVSVCDFGAPAATATRTVALIGDSHASMWRAALQDTAATEHWHGLSVAHSGCPLSEATRLYSTPALEAACATWKREVLAWLAANPQISVVFLAAQSDAHYGRVAGATTFGTSVGGYRRAFAALPPSVKHVLVIRDTPRIRNRDRQCVLTAIAGHAPAGVDCAVARSTALPRDPEAIAEAHLDSPRFQLVDMTRYMCDADRCYPVVGGALVLKDLHHLTRVFATTLGPYVLREVRSLSESWTTSRRSPR